VETGLAGATCTGHECVPVAEITALTDIYTALLRPISRRPALRPIGIFDPAWAAAVSVRKSQMPNEPSFMGTTAACLWHQECRHGDALCRCRPRAVLRAMTTEYGGDTCKKESEEGNDEVIAKIWRAN